MAQTENRKLTATVREYEKLRKRRYRAQRRNAVRKAQLADDTTRYDPLEAPAVVLPVSGPRYGLKIAVLNDAQVRKGVPTNHLGYYGQYIAEKRPDVIVCIGDFADMPSLSSYAIPGSIEAEGTRYVDDIDAAKRAMELFLTPIAKVRGYNPALVMTLGNHEDRISRAVIADPRKLEGKMSVADLEYEQFGWKVIPYLQPVIIGGVAFCHFFPAGVMGRPINTAAGLLRKMHMSAFAGHLQGRDIAYARYPDGRTLTAIISGSFYQHDESYLSPLTNRHWRGAYVLHEVKDGQFDEMALSLNFFLRRYGK